MPVFSAREAAAQVLNAVFYKKAYSNIEINNIIKKNRLDPLERALLSRLVYGVIQNYYILDYYINRFSKIKTDKMSPQILCILRMSMYQIVYLSKIPESAVCDEAVKLVKKSDGQKSAGFVNAVLRSVLREKQALKPPRCKSKDTQLSIENSIPLWMVKHFTGQYGKENGYEIIKSVNKQPPVYIRLNTALADEERLKGSLLKQGADITPSKYLKNAYSLDFSGDITLLDAFLDGLFFVQDLSSQMCVCELSPKEGEVVLDMCCAPGSKSFAAAVLMENRGRVVGFELHSQRTELILQGAKRLGLGIVDALTKDACVYDEKYVNFADRVLVDAPCSGLGTIAKKPDIRLKEKDELFTLKSTQLAIINNAAKYLKPGGVLIYSTCTLNRAENEDIIEEFLKNNSEFELCMFELDSLRRLADNKGHITIMPWNFESDGFFIARMIKKQVM